MHNQSIEKQWHNFDIYIQNGFCIYLGVFAVSVLRLDSEGHFIPFKYLVALAYLFKKEKAHLFLSLT